MSLGPATVEATWDRNGGTLVAADRSVPVARTARGLDRAIDELLRQLHAAGARPRRVAVRDPRGTLRLVHQIPAGEPAAMSRRRSDDVRTTLSVNGGEEIDVTDALNRVGANADLRSFFNRAVTLEEERRDAAKAVKEVLEEAKSAGFDKKALSQLLKRHFEDETQRAAREATEMARDLMARALGEFASTPLGDAAMASASA